MRKLGQTENRKGFLFVVTIFLILTYILLSLSVWVKSIETAESGYSEIYKESNVGLAMDQITQDKIRSATSIVLNRALFVLNNYSINHPLNNGSAGNDYQYVNASFAQWLVNGSPDQADFLDGAAPSEPNSSMTAWMTSLNNSMSAVGVYVDGFVISNFSISQLDIQTLNYSYDLQLGMRDISGATSVSRTYHINGSLNITGLPDPAIARASAGPYQISGRKFYFYDGYTNTQSMIPKGIPISGQAGQGWFYGYLVNTADASSVNAAERGTYALVGSYQSIINTPNYVDFGAYIVTSPIQYTTCTVLDKDGKVIATYQSESNTFNPVVYSGPTCTMSVGSVKTANPFVVAPGFDIAGSNVPYCPNPANGSLDRQCMLFTTNAAIGDSPLKKNSGPQAAYDVEQIRDYTLCGYYVADPNAPSYLHRLMNNSYQYHDAYGISTFLVGTYVNDSIGDSYSRLDNEMFSKQSGTGVRGLPGCKNPGMCDNNPVPDTGISRLSTAAINTFGLGPIACRDARCD